MQKNDQLGAPRSQARSSIHFIVPGTAMTSAAVQMLKTPSVYVPLPRMLSLYGLLSTRKHSLQNIVILTPIDPASNDQELENASDDGVTIGLGLHWVFAGRFLRQRQTERERERVCVCVWADVFV